MAQHAGFSRFVYNYGLSLLEAVKDSPGSLTTKVSAIRSCLTNITKKKPEFAWMNKLSSKVYQHALIALKNAYTRFFQGISGYPTFKRKRDKDSFSVDGSGKPVLVNAGKKIKIPTLGTFRLYEKIQSACITKTFTISRTADKWYVSFAIDADKLPPLSHEVTEPIGIDLGVKTFATISDGSVHDAPKPYKKAKTKQALEQWRNRNKQLGNGRQGIRASNNAKKFFKRIAKTHARISNIREDFLHKTTTEICRKYSHIRIEDLNVQGMIANHKLASAISDLGFSEFRRQLTYKASAFGCHLDLVDRWYPSSKMCNCCHHIQPMPLSERVFVCENCNYTIDRDLGASINLANAPSIKVVRLV
jgi:putative transposase